jgi:thymidylate kinase
MTSEHELWVLLGGDYAGKSSVMAELAGISDLGWRFASYDERFLGADDWLVRQLRDDVGAHLPEVIARHSADFVLTLVQSAVLFLRDEALAHRAHGPVLIDSYHYKFLAKCRLHGLVNDELFAIWRAFPRPDRIVYLDVPPAVAWRRSGSGSSVNALETSAGQSRRAGFERFQSGLRSLLFEEIGAVPVEVVDADDAPAHVSTTVEKLLRSAHA